MLASRRLIDAQPHRGLFVMPGDQWNYLDVEVLEWVLEKGARPDLVHSLIDVRSLIEPSISRWAAERHSSSTPKQQPSAKISASPLNWIALVKPSARCATVQPIW